MEERELALSCLHADVPNSAVEVARMMNQNRVIENISSSRVFEYLPEEWPSNSARNVLVITKLQLIVALSLKIMVRVVTGLKGFGDARERAAAVIGQYAQRFSCLLKRAAGPGAIQIPPLILGNMVVPCEAFP